MKHLVALFGLNETRLKHIILFVFQYIEVRASEGETDLNKIKAEIFAGNKARFKAALGKEHL